MKINLKVPKIFQKKNSKSCCIISTYMVLKYHKKQIPLNILFSSIPHKKDKGTVGPAIILGLEKLSIRSKLIVHAPWFIRELNHDYLNSLINSLKNKKELYEFEINYLKLLAKAVEHKLNIEISEISPHLIENYIKKRKPIICAVNSTVFRNRNYGKYVGHCIVIKGYDSENFYLNDPYWPERNTTKIPKYRLIAAIYSSKIPEILVIE